ncbi:MAG: DUF3524 domain-containing protein [candidate division KSB1 bacterium]|nr:DUF3524 domain-containing protein [candidate division KSB1 bacterium]
MKILILEPYWSGSHAAWASGYQRHSRHQIRVLSMSGQFWKWRLRGSAIALSRQFLMQADMPDLLLATDMLDVASFMALTRHQTAALPLALYFHENQLTYPWQATDRDVIHRRELQYGFINYLSALAADAVFFNSNYHRRSFLQELPRLLQQFPDYRETETIRAIANKSEVLPLGIDLQRFDQCQPVIPKNAERPAMILWNHRWEYDKNPGDFFRALDLVAAEGLDFGLIIMGQNLRNQPTEFEAARLKWSDRILHYGFISDDELYAAWLRSADILPVTSLHDFGGISVIEAIYAGCYPLLPRRLVYPEIVPMAEFSENFYDDVNDLAFKLQRAIQNIQTIRKQNLTSIVERYSWHLMAPIYDKMFERVCQAHLKCGA